jgi:hypothetical protein
MIFSLIRLDKPRSQKAYSEPTAKGLTDSHLCHTSVTAGAAAEAAAERKTAKYTALHINIFLLQLPSKPSALSVTRARPFYVALAGAPLS